MVFRAYFNRHREAPQVWSIDEGGQDTEINVIAFHAYPTCSVGSRYNGEKANEDSPSAWIEINADQMVVREGIAYFLKGPNGR